MFDRRGVLKFLAGGVAGVLAGPIVWKSIDDAAIWSQNWSWRPQAEGGATSYKATISKICPSNQGLLVRFAGERPVRAIGNPDHPLSMGGLSALAAAEVQLLYSPARVRQPMRRTGNGQFSPITWEEAMNLLADGLKKSMGADNLLCISGDESGTMTELFAAATAALGSSLIFGMPSEAQAAAVAWDLSGGTGQLGYDIEKADYILAVGANVLENWGTVLRNRHAFAQSRPHGEDPSVGLAYAGPVQNNTAAVADMWLPIKPGTEVAFCLGLAHLLMQNGASSSLDNFPQTRDLAAQFPPDAVAKLCGIEAAQLQAVAKALMNAKHPLVLAGSADGFGNGAAPVVAGITLNALLGNLDAGGLLRDLPLAPPVLNNAPTRAQLAKNDLPAWVETFSNGTTPPAALIVYEANPAYALPNAERAAAALAAIPFKVAFTGFLDETAGLCDLVLPVPMGLERHDDADTPYGCGKITYTQSAPLLRPLVDAKPADEVLSEVLSRLGLNLGVKSLQEAMQAKAAAYGAGKPKAGVAFNGASNNAPYSMRLRPDVLAASVLEDTPDGALALTLVTRLAMGTPNSGIPPFNTKTIRRSELAERRTCIMLNSVTAAAMQVKDGDMVSVYTPKSDVRSRISAVVRINEGVALDTAAVLAGLGHTALDEFSAGKGENILHLVALMPEPLTGLAAYGRTRIDIVKE